MTIRLFCPNGHKLNAPDSLAGKKSQCPKCHAIVWIPQNITNSNLVTLSSNDVITSENWFVQTDMGEIYGPVSIKILQTWYLEGRLHNSFVRKEGTSDWLNPDYILGHTKPPVRSQTKGISYQEQNTILLIKNDIHDLLLFYKECLHVYMRLNPFNFAYIFFNQALEGLDEDTEPEVRVSCFEKGFTDVNEIFNDETIQSWESDFCNTVEFTSCKFIEQFEKAFPNSKKYMVVNWAEVPKQHIHEICDNLFNQVKATNSLQENIFTEYVALWNLFPKWRAPFERSGLMEGIVGFAAGFLGGPLGLLGADAYDGFREELDSNNVNKFATQLDNWENACITFLNQLENIFFPMVEQIMGVIETALDSYLEGLGLFAQNGGCVQQIFKTLHNPSELLADDEKETVEMVFNNLRDNGLSYKSERNIREIIGFRN